MVKLTLLMLVNDDENYLNESIKSILNQSFSDFELICINLKDTENSLKLLSYYSNENERIIIRQGQKDTLMDFLNEMIIESNGDYIMVLDSLVSLYPTALDQIYKNIIEKNVDLLMFHPSTSNNQINKNMKYLSRITGNNVFNYQKISEILFEINDSLCNVVFKKSFLTENDITFNTGVINGLDEFFYNTLLNAKNIFYLNQNFYETINQGRNNNDSIYFIDYLNRQNNIVNLFTQKNILVSEVNNKKISNSCSVFEQLSYEIKKQAYSILREDFLNIINSENAEKIVMTLNNENKKKFEQVIISETVEEYDLLKKINEDKQRIYFMERYGKILSSERLKIKKFNNSLVSSNSWKLTKIFRLK